MDKTVGERTFNYLNHNFWNEALDLGARLARHDNTRRSAEEILGLIIGKDAFVPFLLKEIGRVNTFEKEQRLRVIRIARIRGAAYRARNNRKDLEYRWKQKLAGMSAELDRVKTIQEKEAIKRRVEKEREDQECKRNIYDAIQEEREERINKTTRVLGDGVSSVGSISNLASASDNTIGDALVSGVKILEGTLPGDAIAKRQERYSKYIAIFPSFGFDCKPYLLIQLVWGQRRPIILLRMVMVLFHSSLSPSPANSLDTPSLTNSLPKKFKMFGFSWMRSTISLTRMFLYPTRASKRLSTT